MKFHGKIKDKIWSKKPFVLYVFVILLSLSVFYIHFKIAEMQKSDSVIINLAGRQRMLTQKLAKELLQFHLTKQPEIDRDEIRKTIKVFNMTLLALLNGGKAPLDLSFQNFIQLPKVKTYLIKTQLEKVVSLWEKCKKRAIKFITRTDFKDSHDVIKCNEDLLSEMNKAVFMMQAVAERNNHNINLILYATYFFVVLVVIILFAMNLYKMKHTRTYIEHLEAILPICANCKKIREPNSDPKNKKSWTAIESYVEKRSDSMFSHSICPSCEEELYGEEEWYKKRKQEQDGSL